MVTGQELVLWMPPFSRQNVAYSANCSLPQPYQSGAAASLGGFLIVSYAVRVGRVRCDTRVGRYPILYLDGLNLNVPLARE